VTTVTAVDHFDSDGVDIAFLDTGGGKDRPPVLLIHGFASNVQTNWSNTGWVEFLAKAGYRVIAFDNRGHGQSQKLYELNDYSAPLMAEDGRRLLDHLGIGQAHVIGYSMGARIAALLALAHPKRVVRLVFGGLGVNMVRGMAGTGPIARALEAESIEDVTNPTARTFRAFAEQTKSDLKALAACIRSARAPITAEMVGTIGAPVFIAVGEDDVIGGSAEELAKLIPGARAYTIPGRDHNRAVGDQTFKAEVLAFLGVT
jgi:pimeloyl-ACP methyl ester carboxylesterase